MCCHYVPGSNVLHFDFESNLTMFTSNEYEEEYGLFLYNAT